MNNLKAKLKKQGGFTLIEMLIVVAIIAILIAVSIPLVNQALERARDATDQANERAAKAEAVLVYMGVADISDGATGTVTYTAGAASPTGPINYDAIAGRLTTGTPTGYGKCTTGTHITTGMATQKTGGNDDAYLEVSWDVNGNVTLEWK